MLSAGRDSDDAVKRVCVLETKKWLDFAADRNLMETAHNIKCHAMGTKRFSHNVVDCFQVDGVLR